jgi:hypothetical protein
VLAGWGSFLKISVKVVVVFIGLTEFDGCAFGYSRVLKKS